MNSNSRFWRWSTKTVYGLLFFGPLSLFFSRAHTHTGTQSCHKHLKTFVTRWCTVQKPQATRIHQNRHCKQSITKRKKKNKCRFPFYIFLSILSLADSIPRAALYSSSSRIHHVIRTWKIINRTPVTNQIQITICNNIRLTLVSVVVVE